MAADPRDPRTKRRAAMGDDPNKISMSVQPLPGTPQGPGNIMNNPNNARSFNPMPSAMSIDGSPVLNSPYGDNQHGFQDGRLGSVDPNMVPPSNMQQGRGYKAPKQNSIYPIDGQPVPDTKQMEMMEPINMMMSADKFAWTSDYEVGPMGMAGRPAEVAINNPISGALSPAMPGQTPGTGIDQMLQPQQRLDGGMNTSTGKRGKK